MRLSIAERDRITQIALSYINTPRSPTFRCVDFVRKVYGEVGIIIPPIPPDDLIEGFCVSRNMLSNPPHGHLMFLKDRNDLRKNRLWTHVVIVLKNNYCVHCSFFFGEKVTVSPIVYLLRKRYDFIGSATS